MQVSEATFEWIKHLIINLASLVGHDAVKRLVQAFMGQGEKAVEEYAAWIEYRAFKRVPPLIYDMYQQALAEIRAHWPLEATRLMRRQASLGSDEHQDHFTITSVQMPADPKDDKQWAAGVERTIKVLRDYARMPDPEWKDAVNALNIDRKKKQAFWTRFVRKANLFRRRFVVVAQQVAVQMGGHIQTAATAVDAELTNAANAIEPTRARIETAANNYNAQRASRGFLRRLFGI